VGAAGGHGTVSTVASIAVEAHLPLGVLPLGTLNHFAHDVGIAPDLETAIRTLKCGRIVTVDVGEVNGRTFLNNSSVGLYPRLVWEREQEERRGRRKWTAMALAAVRVWRQYRRITVAVGGHGHRRHVRTPFVFIGNNEYAITGARIDSRARLDAGRLQLCMAPDASRGQMAAIVMSALAGRLAAVGGFESVLATDLTIEGRRHYLGVSLDGEVTVMESPLRYRTRPRALSVIVPQEPPA
jgi:diacylglycerol kinase family enzyme